ncbi:HalOD1 output domain-containing protein [Halorussus caseinilyticus]|uniref:HalOD1 output domain-containing protein n=1 Tax=Halorussus caseinilyticus TaxID=3034025 RepID=A0ABD5WTY5_9EURY|nr:HalOD1 output domain-containing protein [Halorussus sp. DT72]
MQEPESLVATAVELGNYSPNVSQAFYDAEGNQTLVQTILEALEDASECPSDELTVRLYDAVDPDALEAIFRPTRSGPPRDAGRVSFSVGRFVVDVHATGHVFVRRTN